MKSNCKLWARNYIRTHGGWLVSRPTKHIYKWPIKFHHEGVLPAICPDYGTPCPYILAFVPYKQDTEPKYPSALFDGYIQHGDK